MGWKVIAGVYPSYDYAHRHYAATKYRVTGRLSATGLTDSSSYFFYVEHLEQSGTVPARTGRNIDITYSSTSTWNWRLNFYFSPAETYTDIAISNPAVTVTEWGAKATAIINLSKASGAFIDPRNPEVIKVYANTNGGCFESYSVEGGTCYYKKSAAETYSSFAFSGRELDFTGRLDGNSTYDVYVNATLDDGTTATSAGWVFSTVDGPAVATPVSPINLITYGTADFVWTYSNPTGTAQKAFDIELSDDGETWTFAASHVVSTATEYTAPVVGAGTKYWRVRGYNQDDVAGAWSETKTFVNYVKPDAPTGIDVSGAGRKTIEWGASDQVAYQVIVGDIDSGWIYSASKSYFLNEYLRNGRYVVKVRIINPLGLASDWSEVEIEQSMSVSVPEASVTMREGYNEIEIEEGLFDHFYILRNGTVIAKTAGGMFLDYFCNGEDNYVVRGVMADDTFADTELIGNYVCRKPALITLSQNVIYVNERLDEEPTITSAKTLDVATVQYMGRTKPVHHLGTMLTRTWAVACSRDIDVGVVYFYRNFRGDKAWVICSNVQSSLNSLGVHEYTYTLEETDYSEGIKYEL